MISIFIKILEQFIVPLGGFGVFIAEVVEEIIVPIPSAVILLGSGFFFLKGPFTFELLSTLILTVVIPATFGLTIGSMVIYWIAYKGGKPFLDKYGKWFSVSWSDVESVNRKFEHGKFDELTIVLARVFPIIPSVLIAVFCGLMRMPYKKYMLLTFIGAFFKALLLGLLGWQVGVFYIKYADVIGRIENAVLLVTVLCVAGFILYRKINKKVI